MSSERSKQILERAAARADSSLPLPRVLVVLAHPDDEVLALGARLERYRESVLLCVTDGAPADGEDMRAHGFATLEEYREARRRELEDALRLAGVPVGQARTLRLIENGETVADKAAMLHLAELAWTLAREIELLKPEAVLTHPYEGGHPDHDSCAFAVHTAARLVAHKPVLVEAPSYYAGEHGMVTGEFLPPEMPKIVCELTPEEQARKRERLACFPSQQDILANFGTARESLRLAPEYDFTRAPHDGPLLYEGFGWGLTGAQFCRHAEEAINALDTAARA